MDGRTSSGRVRIAACAALFAIATAGAVALWVGVGSRTAEAAPSVSPFAGSWSGTWSLAVLDEGGTFDWTISDAGRIKGTVTGTADLASGTIVGTVGADGKLMFVGYAPNDVPAGGFNGFPFQGTAVIDGDGDLVASAVHRSDGLHWLVAVLQRN